MSVRPAVRRPVSTAAGRVLLALAGAVAARVALRALRAHRRPAPPGARAPDVTSPWARTNYRGVTVSLTGGPALAAAAALTAAAGAAAPAAGPAGAGRAAAAALTAGLASGAVGLYDDLVGARPEHRAKGFHGHLAALRQGRITSGMVKVAGIGAAGLTSAALVSRRARGRSGTVVDPGAAVDLVLGAGVVAGAANLLNLLDLRPGRALKVGLLVGVPLAAGRSGGFAAGPVGAAVGMLPDDLAERTMLGDCGANALGALLGTALAARTGRAGRVAALAVIAGLTAASERVSFTQVIAATPVLRELDELGRRRDPRRPAPGAAAG